MVLFLALRAFIVGTLHLSMSRATRKGENYELSVDLNSEYRDKRKDAIKRTIASMTVGKGTPSHEYTETFTLFISSRR